jgi:hypothetical protein
MRQQPIQAFGDPNAPFATVAGQRNLYPYGTPLISPQFPQQQFSFRDTGAAPGIQGGTQIDIATANRQMMNSAQINQPNVQFSPGYVTGPVTPGIVNQPLYPAGTVATPQTPLATGDINPFLYGNTPFQPSALSLGYDPTTAPQGLGFDTSIPFGSDLPPPPDTGGAGGFTPGIEMPPLSMATPDLSNLPPSALMASNVPGGALGMTDPGQVPSVEVGGGGPIGSAPLGGYNYSPGPGGSTYVYDANWNFIDTIPGTPSPTQATAPTPTTSDVPALPALPVSDVTGASPYSGQTPLTSFQPVQSPSNLGSGSNYYAAGGNTFGYGGTTAFGTASSGLYGGLEGGVSTTDLSVLGGLGGAPYGFGPRIL